MRNERELVPKRGRRNPRILRWNWIPNCASLNSHSSPQATGFKINGQDRVVLYRLFQSLNTSLSPISRRRPLKQLRHSHHRNRQFTVEQMRLVKRRSRVAFKKVGDDVCVEQNCVHFSSAKSSFLCCATNALMSSAVSSSGQKSTASCFRSVTGRVRRTWLGIAACSNCPPLRVPNPCQPCFSKREMASINSSCSVKDSRCAASTMF